MSIRLLEGDVGKAPLCRALCGNLERRWGNIYADNISTARQQLRN